jgi:hypothetical protein
MRKTPLARRIELCYQAPPEATILRGGVHMIEIIVTLDR